MHNNIIITIALPLINFRSSAGCTKDYVQFYYGSSLRSEDLVVYSIHADNDGRFCDSQSGRFLYTLTETATVFLHTDGSGSGSQAFQLSFKAVGRGMHALCCTYHLSHHSSHNCVHYNYYNSVLNMPVS